MGKNAKNNLIISGHNNPFKNKFGNKKSNFKGKGGIESKPSFKKEWGKEKFVPKLPKRPRDNSPIEEEATPWGHFKTELLEKEKEEAHANAVNMNSAEAKEILKQREQNYRRTLITSQSQAKQPTKWEKFKDDDEASSSDEITEKVASIKPQSKKPHKNNKKFAKKQNFAGIELEDFDSKKLTFKQNNDMRKALTKGFMSVSDKSLAGAVADLKRKKQQKKGKSQAFKKPDFDTSRKQKRTNPFNS